MVRTAAVVALLAAMAPAALAQDKPAARTAPDDALAVLNTRLDDLERSLTTTR